MVENLGSSLLNLGKPQISEKKTQKRVVDGYSIIRESIGAPEGGEGERDKNGAEDREETLISSELIKKGTPNRIGDRLKRFVAIARG